MYGVVHVGFRDLIQSEYGEQKWEDVLRLSTLSEKEFIAIQSYPDSVTFQLVGAAIEVLNVSMDCLMEAFGRHWVLYTTLNAYGDMLDMGGDSVPELLGNLDDIHVRLANSMPDLKAPSFQCENVTDNSLTLHYRSHRQGLTPMVVGLVKGVGEKFQTPCEVSIIESDESGDGAHSVFFVTWKEKESQCP